MARKRTTAGVCKPLRKKSETRKKAKKGKFRNLLPRVGFDFRNPRCRALLDGLESRLITECLKSIPSGPSSSSSSSSTLIFAPASASASTTAGPDLNKSVVDQALALLFEQAIAAMNQDPDDIAETVPGIFWGPIKEAVPWARELSASVALDSDDDDDDNDDDDDDDDQPKYVKRREMGLGDWVPTQDETELSQTVGGMELGGDGMDLS